MAAQIFDIHSETPQQFRITKIAHDIREGAVILYPTDTGWALGCDLSNKQAIKRVRDIRNISEKHPLTFLCESLTNISEFAKVSNSVYRAVRRLIPGPYTFILPATRNVPRFAQDPKRKTTGIRVPDATIAMALLRELGHPLISISAKLGDEAVVDHDLLISSLESRVDIVVTSRSYSFQGESTVIDMTGDEFEILRAGAGIENVVEHLGIAMPV